MAALLGVGLFGADSALVAIPMVAAIPLIMREVLFPGLEDRQFLSKAATVRSA